MTIFTPTAASARNWPMALTIARLLAAPAAAALILYADHEVFARGPDFSLALHRAALVLFVLAAITDAADGWLARKLNVVSPLGAALDHIADKALCNGVLLALAVWGARFDLTLCAAAIILRDVAIAGLREGLSLEGRALPVDKLGKLKTLALMLGLGLVLGAKSIGEPLNSGDLGALLLGAGAILVLIATLLSLWSGGIYLKAALSNLSDRAR